MVGFFDKESGLSEAEDLYYNYISLECANKLKAYNFMGFVFHNISNFERAKEYLILGEDEFFIKETNIDEFIVNQVYTALVLIIEKDFNSAIFHLNRAEKLLGKVDDNTLYSMVYQNKGLATLEMGELESSEEYYRKALKLNDLDSFSLGFINQNLARINLKRGDFGMAKEYVGNAEQIWYDLKFGKGIYLLSIIQAKLFIKNEEYKKALNYIHNGRKAHEYANILLAGENYLLEAEIHENLQNEEAKAIALENAILNGDDLSDKQLDRALSELALIQNPKETNIVLINLVAKLRDQNKNQKRINVIRNKLMDTEIDEGETKIKTQFKYISALSTLLLLLLYLVYRLRKQKKSIEQLNKNLELSKKEVEDKVNRLEQKNEELEQFAFVASHDLKSPLKTISSFAGLLKEKYNGNEPDEIIDLISKSANNMTSMITELLKYSTLDEQLVVEKTNLKTLIDETIHSISTKIKESGAQIKIDGSCNQSIYCDKSLFAIVIQNLITNSINYGKENEVTVVSLSAKKISNDVIIEFNDNGIGIDPSFKDKIFNMFTRIKMKKVDGTGIGLSTCKKIIEKHNGTINVDSSLGKGSTFIIRIPAEIE